MPLPLLQPLLGPIGRALTTVVKPYQRRRNRRVAARLARHQRGYVRKRLQDKLLAGGFELSSGPRSVSASEVAQLLGTFRVEDPESNRRLGGAALLDRLHDRTPMAYLLDAPSGEGKTTFALALALHSSQARGRQFARGRLAALYLDVAESGFDARLRRWVDELDAGHLAAGRRLDIAPLIMLDGVNETLSVEAIGAAVEPYLESLRNHRARLIFLFSHRHPSFVGQLVQQLVEVGTGAPIQLELTLMARTLRDEPEVELGFYPHAVQQSMGVYAAAHPDWALTRADGAALMRWLHENPGATVDRAPSPAALVAEQFVVSGMRSLRRPVHDLATAAFGMLGEESLTRQLRLLDKRLGGDAKGRLDAAASALAGSSLGDRAHVLDRIVQIDSEQATRVLGALYVAQRLLDGDPPTRLSGRTAYDVAAPFVPWALRWLAPNAAVEDLLEREIGRELTRTDRPAGQVIPYSFYGRVLLAGDAPHTSPRLKVALFRSIIDAIDRDRQLTCDAAIRAARRVDQAPHADPVLDQLFALVGCAGPTAIPALLDVMNQDDSTSEERVLVRSQVAYLLVAWLGQLAGRTDLTPSERSCVGRIAKRMHAGDPNLHLRFHQTQIVEGMWALSGRGLRQDAVEAAAAIADADCAAAPPGAPAVYGLLQDAVGQRASSMLAGADVWKKSTPLMLNVVDQASALRMDRASDRNLVLECWEVALGLSTVAFREAAKQELKGFVLDALTHELWIVRWWAYSGLTDLFTFVAGERQQREAVELARHIVNRLVAPGEPVGLKQQQCALVERLLETDSGAGVDVLRAEIGRRRHEVLSDEFAGVYFNVLGQSEEPYLRDFIARVHRLPLHVV
jgi:hypothetical protein